MSFKQKLLSVLKWMAELELKCPMSTPHQLNSLSNCLLYQCWKPSITNSLYTCYNKYIAFDRTDIL